MTSRSESHTFFGDSRDRRSFPCSIVCGATLLLILALRAGTALGQESTIRLELVAEGLNNPVAITHAGDESDRLFLVSQSGRILVHDGAQLLAAPFLDISNRISCCGERGLLGLAFHPNYVDNGRFFVNYTDTGGDTVVAEYRVSASNPNRADAASETRLLGIPQPFSNHNGGQLAFGPNDGYLYIGTGDGGSGGDPQNNAQNPQSLLGKLLRIDVDTSEPYSIPPDNPFARIADVRNEIWALGLRNPWRFSFDRANGDLFVGDVGQRSREEVSLQRAGSTGGENYGWRRMEGSACFEPQSGCDDGSLELPIVEYNHTDGCSITGGYRYRGRRITGLAGTYVYADFCAGWIRGANPNASGAWRSAMLLQTDFSISSFGEGEDGELYVAAYSESNGEVYRIVSTREPPRLAAAVLPLSRSVTVGAPATAFATVINDGSEDALGCSIGLESTLSLAFDYQTTDPDSNALTGQANTPVTISAGGSQSFVVALTPSDIFDATDVALRYECSNAPAIPATTGLNTLLLSASRTASADVVALAATVGNDGILRVGGNGGAFAVATVNVGASASISVSVDSGGVTLPIDVSLCETDPVTSACKSPATPGAVTLDIPASQTASFAVFVSADNSISFDPAVNRLFVRFRDASGAVRGATSVAVRAP